jgi:DNA-binding response OmpR family regulator
MGDQDQRPPRARRTILIVDDDPFFLRMTTRFLRDPSVQILTAEGSDAALAVAAAHPDPIDVLITDVVLPGLDGGRLAARLQETQPGMQVLFMSGYSFEILAEYGVSAGADRFVNKPFTADVLRARVARAHHELDAAHGHPEETEEVLSMCLACRRVRTGPEVWEDGASYLARSAKSLSHGYCAGCAAGLAAELDELDEREGR